MKFIDTHAHIYYDDYKENINDIIHRANEQGINKIISIGVDLQTSEECIKLADKFSCVYASCGYHPHEASKAQKKYLYELENFYQHPKVVGIGEIGLDFHYDFSEPIIQDKIFKEQLELAKHLNAPSIIHCRESEEAILNGINEIKSKSGVIHCFSSNIDFANAIIKKEFNISFTGMVTFVKNLTKVIEKIPLEKIMLETDSPYLTPIPLRGKTNEPANVILVAKKIAAIKNLSLEQVADATYKTAHQLFTKLKN